MKKLLIFIFCCFVLSSFSQKNLTITDLSELKDVNSIKLDNNDFIGKYILVFNIRNKSDIKVSAPYFKEVASIYKNAFFNGIESKGLTVLFLVHNNKINHHEYPVFHNNKVIPYYSHNNSKILNFDKAILKHQNVLINSHGKPIAFDFVPSDLRLDLTKYLKRE
jgi:hypothetical protein